MTRRKRMSLWAIVAVLVALIVLTLALFGWMVAEASGAPWLLSSLALVALLGVMFWAGWTVKEM